MTSGPIPFTNLQESGFDELGGASPTAFNVVVDGKGVVSKRPGIQAATGVYSGVVDATGFDGAYVAQDGSVFATVGGGAERPIYRLSTVAAAALGGGLPPAGLRGSSRPVFAETEMLIVIAGGREMQKIEKAAFVSARLGGPPPIASHVISLSNRLLANDLQDDKTKVRYSDVALGTTTYAGHEVWSLGGVGTSGYFTAEVRPDEVVALADNTGEAWVFGQTTLQTFTADPETKFSPVSSIELGCGAPYSIVKDDDSFHWVDQKRRIVKSAGRGYEVESTSIQRTLDGMETTADAYGFQVADGFLDAMCWKFPTDGRTFVYQNGIGWGQWSGWSNTTNNWTPLIVGAVAISPIDGTTLVATTTGRVGQFSLDATTDFGDPIVARITTGYLNRDTSDWKQNKWVKLALRRGDSGETPGPQGFLKWRDRPGEWTGQIPVDFGSSGDREIVLTYNALGVYQYRQWQFEFSGAGQVSLVSATEEFEVLPQGSQRGT
jgi:hypothetical protein